MQVVKSSEFLRKISQSSDYYLKILSVKLPSQKAVGAATSNAPLKQLTPELPYNPDRSETDGRLDMLPGVRGIHNFFPTKFKIVSSPC